MSATKPTKPISKKHQAFIDQYFLCHFNGTEAYMRVFKPKAGRNSARASATVLLALPHISEAITERLSEVHMSADEALKLLADQARSDIGELMDVDGETVSFNIDEAKRSGKTRLIKRIKQRVEFVPGSDDEEQREIRFTEIELYDAQAALDKILRIHGKFIERSEIKGMGANGEIVIISKKLGLDTDKV